MFSLICSWPNGWVNNRQASDWRRHRVHYDVIVMWRLSSSSIIIIVPVSSISGNLVTDDVSWHSGAIFKINVDLKLFRFKYYRHVSNNFLFDGNGLYMRSPQTLNWKQHMHIYSKEVSIEKLYIQSWMYFHGIVGKHHLPTRYLSL